jgi:type III pantothenate kinase
MPHDLLTLDIGNTRTHAGVFIADKLTWRGSADNAPPSLAALMDEATRHLADADEPVAVIASVNPAIEKQLVAHLDVPLLRVVKDVAIPIGRQLDREAIVGEDRLLNAAAAYDTLKQACVVIDVGTAVTVDFVDGVGTFHGGAIAPGAQIQLNSLHAHTAQLPQVQFAKPIEAIGHNTVEAMRTAVFHGIRGMVRELVEQYAEQVGSYPAVIATGGDAQTLFEDYELIERIVPELTLLGLALAYRTAREQRDE